MTPELSPHTHAHIGTHTSKTRRKEKADMASSFKSFLPIDENSVLHVLPIVYSQNQEESPVRGKFLANVCGTNVAILLHLFLAPFSVFFT